LGYITLYGTWTFTLFPSLSFVFVPGDADNTEQQEKSEEENKLCIAHGKPLETEK
jgi:hypothetical protein